MSRWSFARPTAEDLQVPQGVPAKSSDDRGFHSSGRLPYAIKKPSEDAAVTLRRLRTLIAANGRFAPIVGKKSFFADD